jgi:hypothetical protein
LANFDNNHGWVVTQFVGLELPIWFLVSICVVFTSSPRSGTIISIFKEPDWELDSCMEPKLKLELELEVGFLEKKTFEEKTKTGGVNQRL